MKIVLLWIFLLSPSIVSYSQEVVIGMANLSGDEELALQYFQAGEYDKAIVYYEKLYNKYPTHDYYNYYLNCLIQTKNYKKAEKLIKRQRARSTDLLVYHVDLGRVYLAAGELEKKKKEFAVAIDAIEGGTSAVEVLALATAFLGIGEVEFAKQAYLKGRKELRGIYSFHIELADLFWLVKDYENMVNEYLDLVTVEESFMQQVKSNLQFKMDAETDDKINSIVKLELIKRSQKNSEKIIWSEMLVWFYMQQNNFTNALVYAKAVDRRKQLDGEEIMFLAEMARYNGAYSAAKDGYDYIISLGKNGFNFRNATIEKLNTAYDELTHGGIYSQNDLISLELEMNTKLDELGRDERTVPLLRTLAHLEAFYLFKTKAAIQLLEKTILISFISPKSQAECKLELGDVFLLDGQVWEASLSYSQVEKAFKYEPIGQEAKFRNAKIAFYVGDFKWSQVQLNVLKGATSKLIANDAMYWSIVITDNLALDSNPEPLMLFAHADLLVFQNKFDSASIDLDSIDKKWPGHALGDDVLFMRYAIAMKQLKWLTAATYLQKIIDNYSSDILGDDATFLVAELYDYKIMEKERCLQYYNDVFVKHPSSLFAVDARKRYRQLRGDKIE